MEDKDYPPGVYRVVWNGIDSASNAVASGVYLCRMTTGEGITITKRMLLLR